MAIKYPSIEDKFAGTDKEQYLSGPCSEVLRAVYNCYHSSQHLIKGLDCAELFKEYHGCCKKETELAIEKYKETQAQRRNNKSFMSWFMRGESERDGEDSIPEMHICPPQIVEIESADAESE